jgi:hypothetical protein
MATREQLRFLQTQRPFRPFSIHLGCGRSFTVRHPEMVACAPNGREMVVFDDDSDMHLIEMLLVELMEPVKAEPGPLEGNGS